MASSSSSWANMINNSNYTQQHSPDTEDSISDPLITNTDRTTQNFEETDTSGFTADETQQSKTQQQLLLQQQAQPNRARSSKLQKPLAMEESEEVLPFKDPVMFAMKGPIEVFEKLKTVRDNKFCIDCATPNCGWASMYLGAFLCMECAGAHRSFGNHISYVRSLELDKWSDEQLLYMILGGNRRLRQIFITNGLVNKPIHEKYKCEIVRKHRETLHVEVMEQSYRMERIPKLMLNTPSNAAILSTSASSLSSSSSSLRSDSISSKKGRSDSTRSARSNSNKSGYSRMDDVEMDSYNSSSSETSDRTCCCTIS